MGIFIGRTEVRSDLFCYDKNTNTFTAEYSTLQGNGYDILAKLYDDSVDIGFVMISTVSSLKAVFYQSSREVKDGDFCYDIFLPAPETVKKFPVLKTCRVLVFND